MKIVHLLRHAKSSWSNPNIADIDRPLNQRGKMSCLLMADTIANNLSKNVKIYCSPANRTQDTLMRIIKHSSLSDVQCHTVPSLYCFDKIALRDFVHQLDNQITEMMIVGHNPALTEFFNDLATSPIDNFPTCGYTRLVCHQLKHWRLIDKVHFECSCYITPKLLRTQQ